MENQHLYRKLSTYIIDKTNKSIDEDKREICIYGLEVFISTLVYNSIFLLCALITKTLIESLCYFIGFFIVRHFCGGFHANTYLKCHILFFLTHVTFIAIIKLIPGTLFLIVQICLLLFSVFLIIIFAPVDHKNKEFTPGEYKYFRKCSIVYAIVLACLGGCALFFVKLYVFTLSFLIGTFVAVISMLIAKRLRKIEKGS